MAKNVKSWSSPRGSVGGGDGARCEDRLDLGAEEHPVALPAPVQRADADAVAGEEDGALGEVDERDGELALQVLEDAFAVLLVQVDDDLGIGVRAEDVALGLELGLALRIVEQLAVVDDGDGAILVEDRLGPSPRPTIDRRRLAKPKPGRMR